MIQTIKTPLQGAVFCLALCSTTLALGAVNVDLEVQDGALVVIRNNAQCAGGPIDCIEVSQGTQPHLFFELKGACSSSGYRLTKFRIAERNKQWPSPGSPLSAQIASDFCADVNTGYINFMTCENDLRDSKMKLKDYNSSQASVYYEITAANCSNLDEEIYLDPQIKNGGR
ncbi:MAG: hypothetical protein MUP31_08715 [Xanthomonadales bacterium]|nr:hypothetical protein [Xanthomonadales bacterium]